MNQLSLIRFLQFIFIMPLQSSVSSTCLQDWIEVGEYCYRVLNSSIDVGNVRRACAEAKSTMAIPRTTADINEIVTFMHTNLFGAAVLGVTNNPGNVAPYFLDTGEAVPSSLWDSQPPTGKISYCLFLANISKCVPAEINMTNSPAVCRQGRLDATRLPCAPFSTKSSSKQATSQSSGVTFTCLLRYSSANQLDYQTYGFQSIVEDLRYALTVHVEGLTAPIYHFRETDYAPPFDVIVVGETMKNFIVNSGIYNLVGIVGYGLVNATAYSRKVYLLWGSGSRGNPHEGIITFNRQTVTKNNQQCIFLYNNETSFFLPNATTNGNYCVISSIDTTTTLTSTVSSTTMLTTVPSSAVTISFVESSTSKATSASSQVASTAFTTASSHTSSTIDSVSSTISKTSLMSTFWTTWSQTVLPTLTTQPILATTTKLTTIFVDSAGPGLTTSTTTTTTAESTLFTSSNRTPINLLTTASIKQPKIKSLSRSPSSTLPYNTFVINQHLQEYLTTVMSNNDAVSKSASLRALLPYLIMPMNFNYQSIIGMPWASIFIKCFYDEISCLLEKDFRTDFTSTYGSCYTFNHNTSNIRYSHAAGRAHGLKLILESVQDEYICTSESAGFVLSLQDQSEDPFPETKGFYANPGVVTSFVITRSVILKRGNCIDPIDPTIHYYNGSYTVEGCLRACYQHYALISCGCADPRFAKPRDSTYCTVDDINCLEMLLACGDVDVMKETDCNCKEPCRYISYEVTRTIAKINFDTPVLIQACQKIDSNLTKNASCGDHIKKNVAYLEIYYGHLMDIHYREVSAYPTFQFMMDLANFLGLYFNFGVFLIFEVVALLLGIVFGLCFDLNNSKPKLVLSTIF